MSCNIRERRNSYGLWLADLLNSKETRCKNKKCSTLKTVARYFYKYLVTRLSTVTRGNRFDKTESKKLVSPSDSVFGFNIQKTTKLSISDDSWPFESIKIFRVESDWNFNFVGLLHRSFWLQLVFGTFMTSFVTLKLHCLVKDHWYGLAVQISPHLWNIDNI